MTPILCWLRYVLYVPIYLLTLLPERVKGFLVRLLLNKYEDSIIKTSLDMANMDCVGESKMYIMRFPPPYSHLADFLECKNSTNTFCGILS